VKDITGHLNRTRREMDAAGEHAIGYVYVDHEAGLSIQFRFFCKVNFFGQIKKTADVLERKMMLAVRYDLLSRWEIKPLTEKQIDDFGLSVKPEFAEHYRNIDVEPLRVLEFLHPLRAPGYPDDVKFAMIGQRGVEEVWGRLERRVSEALFECKLLNQPKQDFGVNAGDRVVVFMEPTPQGIRSQFVGSVEKAQQMLKDYPKPGESS
jgi:hypothetical protein